MYLWHTFCRYKRLLCSVDLTKDFFFSYSYNIMRSLQKNITDKNTGQVVYETMFVWNEFLTRAMRNHLKNTNWTVALIHGFFKQVYTSVMYQVFLHCIIFDSHCHLNYHTYGVFVIEDHQYGSWPANSIPSH
jgi:hypothetical protein